MTLWIYVTVAMIGTKQVELAPKLKYVYRDEATCNYIIRDLPTLKCVPVELINKIDK